MRSLPKEHELDTRKNGLSSFAVKVKLFNHQSLICPSIVNGLTEI